MEKRFNREQILWDLRSSILGSADYELDEDPDYVEISNQLEIGSISIYFKSTHRETTIEVMNNFFFNRDYSNIIEWLEEHLDRSDVMDEVADLVAEAQEDEWQSHGFRDAADYYHYRFG